MEERYWFKNRKYGLGWRPATWQGWGVVVVYLLSVFMLAGRIAQSEVDIVNRFYAPLGIATLVLLLIMWRTGEPLDLWGGKDDQS